MVSKKSRSVVRANKHRRLRNHLSGTAERPRLAVFRSNNHMYAQIIDDTVGHTLVAASTLEKDVKAELEKTNNVDAAAYLGKVIAQKALDKGIKTVVFNKFIPRLRSRFNNRDHRKIAVIDGYTCFTGGINLADEYMNKQVRFGYWKDNGIMLEGAAAWNFTTMFLSMWDFITGENTNLKEYMPPHELVYTTPSDGYIVPYEDNPWDHEAVGETIYLNLINKANRYIYITTPYLIIDNEMITALITAAKRGVDVKIITPGIPDKKIVSEVTKAYYNQLIEGGIRIYEFTKGFVHEKTFVVDDEYATVGTVNLDYRSLYLHFECGVWLYASSTIHNIKKDVQKTLKESREIKKKGIEKLSFFKNLKRQILKAFAPLM